MIDVEGAVKTYLKATVPELGGRVYFGVPETQNPTMPFATVARVGGGRQVGEVPLEDATVSVDVWGISKLSAVQATSAVVDALQAIQGAVHLDVGLAGDNGQVDSIVWLPDDTVKLARYNITGTVTVHALD